jgi:hypothetical protein
MPKLPSRRALLVEAAGHACRTFGALGAFGAVSALGALGAAGAARATTSAATTAASPAPSATHAWLPRSRRIGQGTLRMLGFTIYDAALYALADFDATAFAAHPLVLEIHYRRSLSGQDIADYSLKEMRRAGGVDEPTAQRWMQFMRSAFPDVRSGDRLTGQWLPGAASSRFAANDGSAVALQDAEFGPRFFGIWLAPQTQRPDMREQLLGLRSSG